MAGALDWVQKTSISRCSPLSFLLLSQSYYVGFSSEKRSLEIAQAESFPVSLVITECNSDSHYWKQTAQLKRFSLIIHHNVPQRKKSIIMFKCSNCTEIKYKILFLLVHLHGIFSFSLEKQPFFSKSTLISIPKIDRTKQSTRTQFSNSLCLNFKVMASAGNWKTQGLNSFQRHIFYLKAYRKGVGDFWQNGEQKEKTCWKRLGQCSEWSDTHGWRGSARDTVLKSGCREDAGRGRGTSLFSIFIEAWMTGTAQFRWTTWCLRRAIHCEMIKDQLSANFKPTTQ